MYTSKAGLIAKLKDLQMLLAEDQLFEGSLQWEFHGADLYQLEYAWRTSDNCMLMAPAIPNLTDVEHWSRLLQMYLSNNPQLMQTWQEKIANISDLPEPHIAVLLMSLAKLMGKEDQLTNFWLSAEPKSDANISA